MNGRTASQLVATAEGLLRTVRVAAALVRAGRPVEIAGLDRQAGFVCAQALDLPPEQGRQILHYLVALLTETRALAAALGEAHDWQDAGTWARYNHS